MGGERLLECGLPLSYGRVPVADVERDAVRSHDFDHVSGVLVLNDFVLDDRHVVREALDGLLVNARLYHFI